MKVPDPRMNFIMTMLKSIGRSHPGELAETCETALSTIAKPQAAMVTIQLPGLDSERFSTGAGRHLSTLDKLLSDYGFGDLEKSARPAGSVVISTDDGMTTCIVLLKYLGNPIAVVAAISRESDMDALPLPDAVNLCGSQLAQRIYSILSPGGPLATELMGRRLLRTLRDDGMRHLAIDISGERGSWISVSQLGDRITAVEIDALPDNLLPGEKDGEATDEITLKRFWPDRDVQAGLWVMAPAGYHIAAGFEDKKFVNAGSAARVKEAFRRIIESDSEYLVKSFEKLKADFGRLVKSERAAAITETAVTINHEINNPLTAILGNTQLMLMAKDKLPADVVAKLQTIERSAIKIRETTTKLMSIIEPVTGPYASGLEMIDIEKSKKKKSQ